MFLVPSITSFWFSRAWWMFLTCLFIFELGIVSLFIWFISLLEENGKEGEVEDDYIDYFKEHDLTPPGKSYKQG